MKPAQSSLRASTITRRLIRAARLSALPLSLLLESSKDAIPMEFLRAICIRSNRLSGLSFWLIRAT